MLETKLRVIDVTISTTLIHFSLEDGRELGVPVDWYPKLCNASLIELRNFRLTKIGDGVFWDDLDECIFILDVLLYGRNAVGGRAGEVK